ncbi:hypothetical protein FK531_07920 [Rhodococcus spelaei]|uniref:Uncharacterized protein n=1 Tax=Rhodococcus spelaei TaxID=2546320 RepID=A0A541BM80_9NOCA|nr:hypothetical protein [Rhodococcus spelaei]TQF73418.1 hypothetical protein FK531_07920 [Rhodococcus spelaei]
MVFEVKATHRVTSTGEAACEIYPDVFIGMRGQVLSRWSGMAMQQARDIVEGLPDGTQEWFVCRGLPRSVDWVTSVAGFRDRHWLEQHGDVYILRSTPVGPMGPSCPPRRLLTP